MGTSNQSLSDVNASQQTFGFQPPPLADVIKVWTSQILDTYQVSDGESILLGELSQNQVALDLVIGFARLIDINQNNGGSHVETIIQSRNGKCRIGKIIYAYQPVSGITIHRIEQFIDTIANPNQNTELLDPYVQQYLEDISNKHGGTEITNPIDIEVANRHYSCAGEIPARHKHPQQVGEPHKIIGNLNGFMKRERKISIITTTKRKKKQIWAQFDVEDWLEKIRPFAGLEQQIEFTLIPRNGRNSTFLELVDFGPLQPELWQPPEP